MLTAARESSTDLTKGTERRPPPPKTRRRFIVAHPQRHSERSGSRPSDRTLDNLADWCHRAPRGVHVFFHHRCLHCARLGVPNLYVEEGAA